MSAPLDIIRPLGNGSCTMSGGHFRLSCAGCAAVLCEDWAVVECLYVSFDFLHFVDTVLACSDDRPFGIVMEGALMSLHDAAGGGDVEKVRSHKAVHSAVYVCGAGVVLGRS